LFEIARNEEPQISHRKRRETYVNGQKKGSWDMKFGLVQVRKRISSESGPLRLTIVMGFAINNSPVNLLKKNTANVRKTIKGLSRRHSLLPQVYRTLSVVSLQLDSQLDPFLIFCTGCVRVPAPLQFQ
jgi:hypothetical protein